MADNINGVETIIVKCPNCGKKLFIKLVKNFSGQYLACPSCGKKTLFEEFERVEKVENADVRTKLPGQKAGAPVLIDDTTGSEYKLNVGVNSVGRDAKSCNADIRIVTSDFSISRMHTYISVYQTQAGSVRCGISNAENKFPTLVNGEKVEKDDVISIKPGDKITMAGSDFHIEIK